MNRRQFFAALAAGAVVTAEGLWLPGQKLISIPRPDVLTRARIREVVAAIERDARRVLTAERELYAIVHPATLPHLAPEIRTYGNLVIQSTLPD